MVGRHCPFLNRNEARCSAHFVVNQLQHAFVHCFGAYDACSSYREMLEKRLERKGDREQAVIHLTIGGSVATPRPNDAART